MSLIDMFDECSKYVEPKERMIIFRYYAEQYSKIPSAYQMLPASEVMEWVERNTVRHFKEKYFKQFEEEYK